MEKVKIIEVKENVLGLNSRRADALRSELKEKGIFLLNLMASPGGGKTTLLKATAEKLSDKYKIGIMEADVASDVDAVAMAEVGVKAIQLHTGGMCHMDAAMTRQGLDELGTEGLDLVVLENVGNLICPAEFDTGAAKNVMLLSVPEGDDKMLKYPLMFSTSDVVIISKTDTVGCFNFDFEKCGERIRELNENALVIPLSAKTGEGLEAWLSYLEEEIKNWKNT